METNITNLMDKAREYEPLYTNCFIVQFLNKNKKEIIETPSYLVSGWNLIHNNSIFKKSVFYISLNQSVDVFIKKENIKKIKNINLMFLDKQCKLISQINLKVKFESMHTSGEYSTSDVLQNILSFKVKSFS